MTIGCREVSLNHCNLTRNQMLTFYLLFFLFIISKGHMNKEQKFLVILYLG